MKDVGCYIIFSKILNKNYIGVCQDSLQERIKKHNSSFYGKNRFTSKANDWSLKLFIPTASFSHAIRLERKIKSMKSSKYVDNLTKYPELINKILLETETP